VTIAKSSALTGLNGELDAMAAAGGSAPDAAAALQGSATELRGLASGTQGMLANDLRNTADALDQLAQKGIADETAVQSLVTALDDLGAEVQAQCDFPLG
jgi:hypothetical protein